LKKISTLINEEEDPFGPGTDLIISLVVFVLLMLGAAIFLYRKLEAEQKTFRTTIADKSKRISELEAEKAELKKQMANLNVVSLKNQIAKLEEELVHRHSQEFPPNILIEEAKGKFASGSAMLTKPLKDYIRDTVVPQIESTSQKFGIDTIMIIGHTDGRPLGRQNSTLDESAANVTENQILPDHMKPGSNVDLGMMRALAVITELRSIQSQGGHLSRIDAKTGFRAYSAGPFLTPEGAWAAPEKKDDEKRRRIEIRFLRERKP
jgi:hypothetical protein